MVIFGPNHAPITKMPVIRDLPKYNTLFDGTVCVANQNCEMLDNVSMTFGIIPNFDLGMMKRD